MNIKRTEDCWIVVTQNQKWPDRLDYKAFTTEKKATAWMKTLGFNITGLALVCVPITFTLEDPCSAERKTSSA